MQGRVVMNKICEACAVDPMTHSFKKVAEKKGISVFYTKPAQAKRYDDTEGILAHADKALEPYKEKKWMCIIDGDQFDAKYSVEVKTGMGLMELFLTKYVDTLVEIKVINPSIYMRSIVKMMSATLSEDKLSKITMLDDKQYSVLQFI